MHHLGHCRLHGAVVAAYHPDVLQLIPRVIALHLHRAAQALRDVYDDDASPCGFVKQSLHPLFLRGIAAAIASHYDAFQFGSVRDVVDDAFLHAGEQGEDNDIGIHFRMGHHRQAEVERLPLIRRPSK